MKRPTGLPAIGHTTMLGLKIMKTLESTLLFRFKPRTKAATSTKRPDVVTVSSPSATSLDLTKPTLAESLDTCIQKNGAMDPFHTMFDQSLFDVGLAKRKNEDITSLTEPLQIPSVSNSVTSRYDTFGVKAAIQTSVPAAYVLGDARESVDRLADQANKEVSSFTIPPSYLYNKGEMVPFSALFPDHLLSDLAKDIPQTSIDHVPVLETRFPFHLNVARGQGPFDLILGNNYTSIEADDLGRLNAGTATKEDGGRTSPKLSAISSEHSGGLSDSPHSSRRSSWATSISAHHEDGDHDQSNLGCAKSTVEPSQEMDKIELIHEYEQYCDLIDVGHPGNRRNRNFSAPLPDLERADEVVTAEMDSEVAGSPTVGASEDEVSDIPKPYPIQAESDRLEERPHSQASMNSDLNAPSKPAEAAAWAHSYCEGDPESAKLKILKDERGREYVLYRDCFHCVPIELAPEFMAVVEEEDDGYGSATETSENARDGTKLGTIPEEENEG